MPAPSTTNSTTTSSTTSSKSTQPQPNALLSTLSSTGKAIARRGRSAGQGALWLGQAIGQRAFRRLEESTQRVGRVMALVSRFPLLSRFAGVLRLDWLLGMNDRVNLEKAAAGVRQLQRQYPEESPSQIAHRIMVQKAQQAAGIGLASSLLPGFAIALLAIDLAATTTLQTEMLYQIAAAYGLDLKDPARQGEVMGIFGLALGGRNATRAGLGFLRNVPLAGALIGASTNAVMLYSLGYAACRYYEAKQRPDNTTPDSQTLDLQTLNTLQQESEDYLERAIAQKAVMDQILAHMILASYPQATWETIRPELRPLNLDAPSLDRLEAYVRSPHPLEELIPHLNCDYAVALLAQCRHIAQQDRSLSPAEQSVLDAIAHHCEH